MKKIALLASSKISSQSIMRCYDWATEISRQEVVVSSGFSSQLERDVLHFFAQRHVSHPNGFGAGPI